MAAQAGAGAGASAPARSSRVEELLRETLPRHPAGARAIRPAPTTPRSALLFDLLGAEAAAGITLTESFAMAPAASICGLLLRASRRRATSPWAAIGRDQVLDYARRKGMDRKTVERWLAPNLGYDPAD